MGVKPALAAASMNKRWRSVSCGRCPGSARQGSSMLRHDWPDDVSIRNIVRHVSFRFLIAGTQNPLSLSLSLSLLPPHPSVSLSLSLFISIYFSLFSSPGLPVGRSGTSTQRTWTMLIDAPSRPSGTIWNVFFSLPSSKSFSRSPRCRAAVVQHLLNKNPFTRGAQKRRSCPKKRSFTTIPWLVNSLKKNEKKIDGLETKKYAVEQIVIVFFFPRKSPTVRGIPFLFFLSFSTREE